MIKTWQQRCEEHPDHDGIVSDEMIRARMQEEIDELRAAIEQTKAPVAWHHHDCEGECIACLIEREVQSTYGLQGLNYLRRHVTARAIEPAHGIKEQNT